MYVIARYSIHLWDINQEGTWERRGTFVYYAELLFEMTALCFDFIHHLHMLVRGYRRLMTANWRHFENVLDAGLQSIGPIGDADKTCSIADME